MSNPIEDAINSINNFLSNDLTKWIVTGMIVLLLILFIIVPVFQWVFDNQQTITELCGLDERIRTNLDQAFIDGLPDDNWNIVKVKNILHDVLRGESVSDSDYQLVLDMLSIAQKKQLNIGDLEISCNLI